jgi:hypothetical protein
MVLSESFFEELLPWLEKWFKLATSATGPLGFLRAFVVVTVVSPEVDVF